MIVRDPAGAEGVPHDLIVVGGGIQGATIALDAVARGLRPLLLERGDFGGETSGASLRILHGGLRYLQGGDLSRFRDSVTQRRWWLQRFPDLVRPLPCVLPLYGVGLQVPGVLRPALAVNDILSWDRNRGVREDRRIPGSQMLSSPEVLERFPFLPPRGLRGGALWYDASMEYPHRLLMEVLRWAVQGGATALNRVEVTGFLSEGDRVTGVRALDRVSDEERIFRAPRVVNAAGPWVTGLAHLADGGDRGSPAIFPPSLAFNLLLDHRLPGDAALAVRVPRPGGQVYFLRPWGPFTLAGTGHAAWPGSDTSGRDRSIGKGSLVDGWSSGGSGDVRAKLVAAFLADLAAALPDFDARGSGVVQELWGSLPAMAAGSAKLARRPVVRDHGRRGGLRGVVSVAPVKSTTAPGVAARALDVLLGAPRGAAGKERDRFLALAPASKAWPLPHAWKVMNGTDPERAARVLREIAIEESALTAEDLVLRRLDWGLRTADPVPWIESVQEAVQF